MQERQKAIMAGHMFTVFFGEDCERNFSEHLEEIRALIDATLKPEALPENGSTTRFRHALCDLESLSIADKRTVLAGLRDRIDEEIHALSVVA